MIEATTPEETVATFALVGLGLVLIIFFLRWVLAGPAKPDPWDESISAQLQSPDATARCHRCVTPHADHLHFCPNCGVAVGDYNNLLPFEQLFSEGEVFRNGTTQRLRPTPLLIAGYILLSAAAYTLFAPFYWFFLLRNMRRQSIAPLGPEEPPGQLS
jgi:hypothetical protein